MRLSMSIIHHFLEKYHPVASIQKDDLTIMGIRMFSFNRNPDRDYLYIVRNRDVFSESDSNEILLLHRDSVISLPTEELEEVFDDLMDIFVYFEKWEVELFGAYQKENPEQHIIDACKELFGPMFFATPSLKISAFSRQYSEDSVNQNWKDFWRLGGLSLNSLGRMEGSRFLANMSKVWECELFQEENVDEYQYSMMISQENTSHALTGQLTVISNTPFALWQVHLGRIIKQALTLVSRQDVAIDTESTVQSLYQEILLGNAVDTNSIQSFYQLQGWSPEDHVILILLKNEKAVLATMAFHKKTLRKRFPHVLICGGLNMPGKLETELVCALPLKKYSLREVARFTREEDHIFECRYQLESPEAFCSFAESLNLKAYMSYPQKGIENLHLQYVQSQTACHFHQRDYYNCGLYDFMDLKTEADLRRISLHPVVFRILQYDQEKKTDFYRLLKTYLRCERDRTKTAEALFVHKNTLVYRLEKLQNLFGLKLDSSYEREYLLVSIRCLDLKGYGEIERV